MELHRRYGDRARFIEVLVRQAHAGERHGGYRSHEDKLEDARGYEREERIRWSVLCYDLPGTVQRAYGGLAAGVYLIDSRGIVAFCGTWGQARRFETPSMISWPAAARAPRPARAPTADRIWPPRSLLAREGLCVVGVDP